MTKRLWATVSLTLQWGLGQFRKPELMVFIPALTLAAFWLGGERMLVLTALAAPLFFAIGGAFRFPTGTSTVPDGFSGLAMRPQIVTLMDDILRDTPVTGMTTACLVVQFDDASGLLDRQGRAAQTEVLARSAERICAALRTGDTVARLEGGGLPSHWAGCAGSTLKARFNFAPACNPPCHRRSA